MIDILNQLANSTIVFRHEVDCSNCKRVSKWRILISKKELNPYKLHDTSFGNYTVSNYCMPLHAQTREDPHDRERAGSAHAQHAYAQHFIDIDVGATDCAAYINSAFQKRGCT